MPRSIGPHNDVSSTYITDIGQDVGMERGDLTFDFMDRYVCIICGYIYDPAEGGPEGGIASGTAFEDIPDDWVCPLCGVGKEHFEKTS